MQRTVRGKKYWAKGLRLHLASGFLPIVARELTVASRRPGTYRARTGAALLAIGVAGVILAGMALQYAPAHGRTLFSILSALAFLYCALAGTRATSDCVSSEKRDGTLGLLFLTSLQGWDVVLGKLISASLAAFYGLFAIVPVLAVGILLGGVTLAQVALMALFFVNTLFFSLCAGLFASTLSRNDRRAMFATGCVVLLLVGGPFVLAAGTAIWRASQGNPPTSLWEFSAGLKVSPAYAFQVVRTSMVSRLMQREFVESLLITHAAGWLLLGTSAWLLPWVKRDRPAGRLHSWWRQVQDSWRYGRPGTRRIRGARLLDRNAYYWLAARDRLKGACAWFLVLSFAGMWGVAAWRLQSFAFEWDISFWWMLLLLLVFKVWISSEVCSRLAEDRTSGAFELLFSTPLRVRDLVRGVCLALWRQFGWPILVTLGLTLLLMLSALQTRHYDLSASEIKLTFIGLVVLFLMDTAALLWTGLWTGATRRNINTAILATCSRVLIGPTLIFIAIHSGVWLAVELFGRPNLREVPWLWTALLWLGIGLLTDGILIWTFRRRVLQQLREIASHRFAETAAPRPGLLDWVRDARRRRHPRAMASAWMALPVWKRRALLGSALCLTGALSVFGWWRYSNARQVQAQIDLIQAAGAPVTLDALATWLPDLPDHQNAAAWLRKAGTTLALPNRWPGSKNPNALSAVDLRTVRWLAPPEVPLADVVTAAADMLAQNRLALEDLHQAALLPTSRYKWDWTARVPQLQLVPLRPAAPLLQVEAWMHLHRQDFAAAFRSVQALLGLAQALGQEPAHFALEQRHRAHHAALGILEQILAQRPPAAPDLRKLAEALNEAEQMTRPAYARALISERCLTIASLLDDRFWSARRPNQFWEERMVTLLRAAARYSGYGDRYLLEYLRQTGLWIDAFQSSAADGFGPPNPSTAPKESRAARGRSRRLEDHYRLLWHQHLVHASELRAAASAVAVELYRIDHDDRLPDSLEQLSPAYLARAPLDPFTSRPLKYRRMDRGYLVYSIGPDGRDNQGAGQTARRAGQFDLVFTVAR